MIATKTTRVVNLLAEFSDRMKAARAFGPGWPVKNLDEVREIALRMAANPPENLERMVVMSATLISKIFGDEAADEGRKAIAEAAGDPDWLLAVRCYTASMGLVLAREAVGEIAAAPFN